MANKNTNKKKAVKRTALPVSPEIDNMSDEEFEEYLNAQTQEGAPTENDKSSAEENGRNNDEKESADAYREKGGNSCAGQNGSAYAGQNGSAYGEESRRGYENGRRQILDRWFSDAQRLKKEVPDFDLDEAMKNNDFRNFVISGMSVDGAYYAVKYKELTKNSRRPIMQNASSRALKSGSSMNDMLNMNDGDFKKRLKSIMNGD